VSLPPLSALQPLLISVSFIIVGAVLVPRGPQSYRSMSNFRFLGALFLVGLGVELTLQIMQFGKPGMSVGLVIGALVVRLAERTKQG
jgi:hypothetical protein